MICDLKPSGRYVTVDLHNAGGIPQVMKLLLDAGLLHGDCRTVEGKSLKELLADVPSEPPSGQEVIRPLSNPLYAKGHLAILKGNLASEGSVAKISGVKTPVLTGPARVFESDRKTALPRSSTKRSRPGMWWWSVTRVPSVDRACGRCWLPPQRSLVRALGTRSP